MRRLVLLAFAPLMFVCGAAIFASHATAVERVCAQWAVKPYRHCVRYAPSPTTSTTTTTTTTVPDVSLCDLGSAERQQAHDDTIHFYIYADNRDTVYFDATIFATMCTPPLSSTAQDLVDCFDGGSGPACIQTPENPPGVIEAVVYFAQALIPPTEPTTTIGSNVDAACRVNGSGRVHAINDVYAYETTWGQPEADQVMADATIFIAVCGSYPGTSALRHDAALLVDCLVGWVGYLPQVNACYLPGNEINRYLHDLLVSSQ